MHAPPRDGRWPRAWVLGALAILLLGLGGASLAGGAALEEHDSFCASCHSQPESTYFARTLASQPVDLASWHHLKDTNCIDCHSGAGILGRADAEALGARDLFRWVTHTAQQPAPQTVPIGDANCLKCHPDTESEAGFDSHFHRFLPRWQAVDPAAARCVDCHTSHTTGGDTTLAYLMVPTTQTVCGRCHLMLREGGN